MNKNLNYILMLLVIFSFTSFIISMEQKMPLKSVLDAAQESQLDFNHFHAKHLYDFEQDRIKDALKTQKAVIKAKIQSLPTSPFILNEKLKKGIRYSLPTVITTLLGACGLYEVQKSLQTDNGNLQNLVYSCAAVFTCGYCLKHTLPYFKIGIFSLYKGFSYKKYLETKLEKNKEASKKINATTNN